MSLSNWNMMGHYTPFTLNSSLQVGVFSTFGLGKDMEYVDIFGFGLAMMVGIVMGLLGSGGSLVVPLMVYVFEKDIKIATAYALFMVGVTALSGVVSKIRRQEVDFSTAAIFAIPVIVGTLIARMVLITSIPEIWFTIDGVTVGRQAGIFFLYAIMLLLSFASMMGFIGKNYTPNPHFRTEQPFRFYLTIGIVGLFIGILSGLVGAGGGVLAVPVLVIMMGLEMKMAVGTSLAIMAIKSLLGFLGDVFISGSAIEWNFLLIITGMMVVGIFFGSGISNHISGVRLRKSFAWFILFMVVYILSKETGLIPNDLIASN
ncbi:sulfite exporter TauE/SafE family protein [Pontibacter sp. G13]|uniref:sulfite exporter TauE/SafE family protein n=1 Tax=Pontibacter sp. G13 TaxID=3074898 RepID=UPI00288BD883|nr:sulfite exporter TauE/SafE family protein [Pontibacter sp. G13]WNJ19334.1 sulfite exporter TauE/SafE family protein [Pontibacter sp. G13]